MFRAAAVPFWLLCLFVLFITEPCIHAQVMYSLTDLGTLGGSSSEANGINDAGEVVGDSYMASGAEQGFLYNGSIVGLGTLGGQTSFANGINDSGQIVGYSSTSTGAQDAYLYSNGTMVDLNDEVSGTDGWTMIAANAINNAGQVTGYAGDGSASDAFLFSNGMFTRLYANYYGGAVGYAINDNAEIAGDFLLVIGVGEFGPSTPPTSNSSQEAVPAAASPPGGLRGFLYTNNGVQDFQIAAGLGGGGDAYGINEAGQVVGSAADGAYMYNGATGSVLELGTLGGTGSVAKAINNTGEVVGYSNTISGSQDAFVFSSTDGMTDLNNVVAGNSGWTITSANAINGSGQIAANATNAAGQQHAVLLSPIPQALPHAPLTYQPPPPELPISNPAPNQVIPDLAVYENGNWVPVTTHSLGSDVHVLVHGWAPGQLGWVQQQLTDNQPADAWDDTSWFAPWTTLAGAIEAKDPGSSVVAYSWIDLSATANDFDAEDSRQWTDTAGDILAGELKEALPTNGLQDLQLFGHSHGARVATIAAERLEDSGINVDQLTLADSPETSISLQGGGVAMENAENDLAPELQKLNLGRSAGQTFVDNYISSFGVPYRNPSVPGLDSIVDVMLGSNASSWRLGGL
jgi:probable HAF family extracellular repeat protein